MLAQATAIGFVSTTNEARARAFYEGLLGLTVHKDDFALVAHVGDARLRITTLPDFKATEAPAFGFGVADIESVVAALTAKDVAFERWAFLGEAQAANGVWTGPDGAKVAWFKDPDGNLLSLTTPAA